MAHIIVLRKMVTFSIRGYAKDYASQRVTRKEFLAILAQADIHRVVLPNFDIWNGFTIHKPGGIGITVYPDTIFQNI